MLPNSANEMGDLSSVAAKGTKRPSNGDVNNNSKRTADLGGARAEPDDTVTPKLPKMAKPARGNETIVLDDSSNGSSDSDEIVYIRRTKGAKRTRETSNRDVEVIPAPGATAVPAANPEPVARTSRSPPPPVAQPKRPAIQVTDKLLALVFDVFPNISLERLRRLIEEMPIEGDLDPLRMSDEEKVNMVLNHLLMDGELAAREEDLNVLNSILANQQGDENVDTSYEVEDEAEDEAAGESNIPRDELDELMEAAFKEHVNASNTQDQGTNMAAAANAAVNAHLTAVHLNSPTFKKSFKNDLRQIMAIMVDCDPSYLIQQLLIYQKTQERVQTVISQLLEKKSYPKLKDVKEKQQRKKDLENRLNMELNMEEFLKLYPDPVKHFFNSEAEMSNNYKSHCKVYLCNKFVYFTPDTIEEILRKHKYHFAPAYKQLNSAFDEQSIVARLVTHHNNHGHHRRIPKMNMTRNYVRYKIENEPRSTSSYEYPVNLDEQFFKELVFVKNETQITNYLRKKEQDRKVKFEAAKAKKLLLECPCCCNDELLDEDMVICPNGHQFCKECIKQFAVTQIGDSKYEFKCWVKDCDVEFSMRVISQVLEPNVFSKMIRNRQNEEIRKADIPNLETCLHCPYAAIIDNPAEKVFYCQNPECLKETCRNCKEPNHLPLRCDEIEKKSECDMRVAIENKVNEAMIRECYKCQKRFYKEEGCNMMHCVCGAAMCYVCRAPIKDYSHFSSQPNGCPQFSDVNELHRIEMEKAYKEALEKYLAEHPELKDMPMKNDPKKMLEEIIKKAEASKKAREQQEARMRELQQQAAALQQGVAPPPNPGLGGGWAIRAGVRVPIPMPPAPQLGPQFMQYLQMPMMVPAPPPPQLRVGAVLNHNHQPPAGANNHR